MVEMRDVRFKRPKPLKDILTGKAYRDFAERQNKEPARDTLIPFLEEREQCDCESKVPRPLKKIKKRVLGGE